MNRYRAESLATTAAIYSAALGTLVGLSAGLTWGMGEIVKGTYSADDAKEYVQESGYTNVKLEDIDTVFVEARGCGKSDNVEYEFSATAPNGTPNVGIGVCKGLLKGATLRQG